MNDITNEADDDVIGTFGKKYGIPKGNVLTVLGSTCFRMDKDGTMPTTEQMVALMVVCMVYDLNPFTKEIFAYPDKKGIIPVVSVDGWIRLINSHPAFNGMTFEFCEDWVTETDDPLVYKGLKKPTPEYVTVSIYRRDRDRPTAITEYLDEVYKPPGNYGNTPWQTHPKRFLRHKGIVQCARVAFGFAGVYDDDEAQRILRADLGDDPLLDDVPLPRSLVDMPEELPPVTPPVAAPVEPAATVIDQDTGEIVSGAPAPAAARPTPPAPPPVASHSATLPIDKKAGEPITPARRKMLQTRMEFNEIDEDRLIAQFGFGLDSVTTANFAEVGNWIEKATAPA